MTRFAVFGIDRRNICGIPPSAETRCNAPVDDGAKTITLSRFHVPPRPNSASHTTIAGPPSMRILLSLPSAKKPIERLSGDQNGNVASSVPGRTCASTALKRSHARAECPSRLLATNTIELPSGEIANCGATPVPPPAGVANVPSRRRNNRELDRRYWLACAPPFREPDSRAEGRQRNRRDAEPQTPPSEGESWLLLRARTSGARRRRARGARRRCAEAEAADPSAGSASAVGESRPACRPAAGSSADPIS